MSLNDSIDEFLNLVDDLTFVSAIRGLIQPASDHEPKRDFTGEFKSMSEGLESKFAKNYVETKKPEDFTAKSVYEFMSKFSKHLNCEVKVFIPTKLLPSVQESVHKSDE